MVNSASDIVFVINTIKCHDAKIAEVLTDPMFFATFHGIRTVLHFKFDHLYAYGYEFSESTLVKKR